MDCKDRIESHTREALLYDVRDLDTRHDVCSMFRRANVVLSVVNESVNMTLMHLNGGLYGLD